MTYIVGISHEGINSILSDLRVTYGDKGQNTALKIGMLFPGCIYGHCGNEKAGRDFLVSLKYYFQQKITTDKYLMGDFLSFIENYDFSTQNRFQLLLSYRLEKEPQFYIFDSNDGMIKCNDNIITLGSGKELLDSFVYEEFLKKFVQFYEVFKSEGYRGFNRELPPYLFSFLLTQMAQGQYYSLLEKQGVGGIFHFISQTGEKEIIQKPTYFVLCAYDKKAKIIYPWHYRTCYVNYWLILSLMEPGKPQQNSGFLDESALPPNPKGWWNPEELAKEFRKVIPKEMEKQVLYYFFGIGHTTPKENPQFGFHIGTGGECMVTNNGLHPATLRWLGIED